MLWKIVKYEKLPKWARAPEYSEKGLYIVVKYPWLRASICPFTLRNFIRTMIDIHKQCKSHR